MSNRRISERVQVGITAYITRDTGPRWSCRTRNVSSRGAFLQTGAHGLSEGSPLQLALVITRGGVSRVFMRHAVVTRIESEGVGIAFSGIAGASATQPSQQLGQH